MSEDIELDPLFDRSLNARLKRFSKRILESRYLLIALLIHALILIVFGGKVLFEAYQRVNLETDSIIAPSASTAPSQPPPAASELKNFDVKVTIPQNSKMSTKLATDKLDASFNVSTPEVQNAVSVSMEGIGMAGGGVGGGAGQGTGFANVKFFGISAGKATRIIFVADISASMNNGAAVGHPYSEVIREVSKAIQALTPDSQFNIVAFAKKGYAYKPKLVHASPQEKEKAIEWFKSVDPTLLIALRKTGKPDMIGDVVDAHLGTKADDALEQAIQMRPAMIMFVSDGIPTVKAGPDGLLKDVQKWQREHGTRIIINAVYYTTKTNSADGSDAKGFMTKLATENGGVFKLIE